MTSTGTGSVSASKGGVSIIRSPEKSSPLRILLVEGSEHDFLAFQRVLQKSPVKSVLTRYVRAEEALERLSADAASFDLVVTDYKLPGISGLELCRELIDRKVSLPLVLLSGAKKESLQIQALKAGFDDFLIKDPDQGYLGHLPLFLLNVVRKHRYRQVIKREAEGSKREAPEEAVASELHEMVCRFMPDRTLTYANDAYCRLFTQNGEKPIGRSFMRFVHDEDKEKLTQHLDALSPENPARKIKYRVVLPTKEVRWQHWSDRAIFDETGSLMEFQAVGWDITAQRKVEGSLHESEARYRLLVESFFNGFFVCEIESGGFLLINKKACDLLGYPMQEVLQRSIWDVVAPEEQDDFREGIRSRVEQKALNPFQDIYTFYRKDGSKFRAEVSALLVPFQGEQVIQGVVRGLADQEGLRLQLERTHELEGIAILSTAVAHQLNNALAEITGHIGRLESDFPQNENIAKYVEPMYDAAGRMSRLSSQLLAYAGSEGNQVEIISLNDTVEGIIPLVRHIIDPAIQLETFLSDDVSTVAADASQIQLKLSMLLTILTEAIDGPGRIRMTTKSEELDKEASKIHPGLKAARYACLAVEVDGKGFDGSTKDKVLQCLSTKGYEGQGREMTAGSAISREHAGWVAVVSEMETGVKVSIYFPVAESKETLPQKPANETVAGEGFILVVEDDDTGVGITRAMLEKLGFHVLEAKTGTEAVHLVRGFEGNIRVAFLDTVLPDMGGLEVYSLLKEISPNTKVIVLSEYANNDLVRGILDAGAHTVIEKPFTVEILTAELKAIFEGS